MADPSILAFSTTAANNGSGVTGINAAEQQAPSTVNDGIRGFMARIAFWRDWQAGNITQGGSSNAYTATTGESIAGYTNSLRFLWKPNANSTGAVTLNVDGKGAKKVFRPDGTQAGDGDILADTLIDVVYVSTLDSSAGGFKIIGGIAEATALSMSGQYKLVGRSSSGAGSSQEIASSADVFAVLGAANNAAILTSLGFSSDGRTFAGAANYAAMRTQLSLVPGTNVQAYAANLTTYAGKTPPSGDVVGTGR